MPNSVRIICYAFKLGGSIPTHSGFILAIHDEKIKSEQQICNNIPWRITLPKE